MRLQKVGLRGRLLLILFGIAVFLQGCMKSDVETYDAYKYIQEDVKTIQDYLAANNIDAEMDSSSGVFYKVHKSEDGYRTIRGVEIETLYQGFTLDGEEFINKFDGSPVTVTLGDEATYPVTLTAGLSIALTILREGDSATVYSPSPYGFRDGTYQNVPPNSILIYNVKFVDIKKLEQEYAQIDQYIVDNNLSATIEQDYGIRYAIHRVGNNITPEPGATITTHYQGELLDGTMFDSSYDRGAPMDFIYGNSEVIVGFEMGVSQLHENDSATIFIPSIYGYKDVAQNDIPANSVLVFGLDISRISNPF